MAQVTVNNSTYYILNVGAAMPAAATRQVVGAELMGLAPAIAKAANSQAAVLQIGGWGVNTVGSPDDVAASIKQAIHNGTLIIVFT